MEKSTLLTSLELLINKTLSLDEHAQKALAFAEPKVIELIVSQKKLYLMINQGSVVLFSSWEKTIDVSIKTTLHDLLMIALSEKDEKVAMMMKSFDISGDLELSERLNHLFLSLNVEWLKLMSLIFGKTLASPVQDKLNGFINQTQKTVSSLRENISEYLQEEAKLSASMEEVKDFCRDVDELTFEVDRVHAKFNALMRARKGNTQL